MGLPYGPGDKKGICDNIWDTSLQSEAVAFCIIDQFMSKGNENESGAKMCVFVLETAYRVLPDRALNIYMGCSKQPWGSFLEMLIFPKRFHVVNP